MEGSELVVAILGGVCHVVMGRGEVLIKTPLAILAGGYILLESIPGVGKTTMALAFSKALSFRYNQVQFTSDTMPSDITGFTLYNKEVGRMEYQSGAVLCNLLLVDELNRVINRTQPVLSEAMEEGQVTVDGISHPVPQSFLIIAAQNPAGASDTQLLPNSQMDQFTVRLSVGCPVPADEMTMVCHRQEGALLEGIRPVLELSDLLALRVRAGRVYVSDGVLDYIVRLVGVTRSHPMVLQGASPWATLTLAAMAKAIVLVRDRDYVLSEDVSLAFGDTVPHWLLLSPRAEADRLFGPISGLLERVPTPRIP